MSYAIPAQHGAHSPGMTRSEWASGILFAVAFVFSVLPSGLSWETGLTSAMLEGSWVVRLQWTSLFVWAWLMMRRVPLHVLSRHFKANAVLLVLVFYCTLTLLWSDYPGIVVKRFVQFSGVLSIFFIVAFHHEKYFLRLLRLLVYLGIIISVASIIVSIAMPKIGIERAVGIEGSWRGVLGQKNLLGIFSATMIYLTFYCWLRGGVGIVAFSLGFSSALICLVMCRSSSSATLLVVSMAIFLALRKSYIRSFAPIFRFSLVFLLFLIIIYIGYFFIYSEFPSFSDLITPFAAIFGKSSDLTGRGDIWKLMWQLIDKHPYFGLGFASFWLGPGGPSQFISDALMWTVPSAHSGYLEIINELGWFGLFLFSCVLIKYFWGLGELFKLDRELSAFYIGFFSIFLISNFSESTALRPLMFLQFMLFLFMVMLPFGLDRMHVQKGEAVV